MFSILLLAAAAQAAPAAQSTPVQAPAALEEAEIVVTGQRSGGCRVRLADRQLSTRELALNARRWAAEGRPVRVVRPRGADYHCLARIAWSLGDHGVRLIHFVDRPD